jgi:hypothetical protein
MAIVWLDYSERERRQALDVISLFREQGTVDELGIGAIRDAFANVMFPGTSTIQTRAAYFLLVPWSYQRLEARRVPSARIEQVARRAELALIDPIVASGERDGVIGIDARRTLRRLPSNVYWLGLRTWGIRRFPRSQPSYHRSLDAFYASLRAGELRRTSEDDPSASIDRKPSNWDPQLPDPPSGFPQVASLRLRAVDAEYLRSKVATAQPQSLLAYIMSTADEPTDVAAPWEHPLAAEAPADLIELIEHARCFSLAMHGSALLYNLMLSEAIGNMDRAEEYRADLVAWAAAVENDLPRLLRWDRHVRFWDLARLPNVGKRALFVQRWLDLVLSEGSAAQLPESRTATDLVRRREWEMKGSRARLQNRSALHAWGGSSFAARLDYRWRVTQRIVNDVIEGTHSDA